MKTRTWKVLLTLAAVGAVAACSGDGVVDVPDGPQFSYVPGVSQSVELCKINDQSPGTTWATFAISSTGGGTLTAGSEVTLVATTLSDPSGCIEIWRSDGSLGNFYVTITEIDMTPGTMIDRIIAKAPRGDQELFGVNTITVDVDANNGALVAFKNVGEPDGGGEGCTPGYWRNHFEDWPATGYAPGDDFDTTFGVDYFSPDITLGDAIWLGGGGVRKLARHGTAGLLSAAHPDVDYPYSAADVIAYVQSGDADPLADANELGCDIP